MLSIDMESWVSDHDKSPRCQWSAIRMQRGRCWLGYPAKLDLIDKSEFHVEVEQHRNHRIGNHASHEPPGSPHGGDVGIKSK